MRVSAAGIYLQGFQRTALISESLIRHLLPGESGCYLLGVSAWWDGLCWPEAGLQASDHQFDALLNVGGSGVAGEFGGQGV
jgi:hypothetical protein